MKLLLILQFLIFGILAQAAKTTSSRSKFMNYVNEAIDMVTQAEVRKQGQSITKWRLSWYRAEDLIKMPIVKLHSIPASSWTGLTASQAAKLTPTFINRMTQEQAKMIRPKAAKAMPEATRRAHIRMVNQPSIKHRLILMGASSALAYALYRYTTLPIKTTNK